MSKIESVPSLRRGKEEMLRCGTHGRASAKQRTSCIPGNGGKTTKCKPSFLPRGRAKGEKTGRVSLFPINKKKIKENRQTGTGGKTGARADAEGGDKRKKETVPMVNSNCKGREKKKNQGRTTRACTQTGDAILHRMKREPHNKNISRPSFDEYLARKAPKKRAALAVP